MCTSLIGGFAAVKNPHLRLQRCRRELAKHPAWGHRPGTQKARSASLPFTTPDHIVHYLTKLTWTDIDDRANHFPRGTSYFPGIGPALRRSRDRAVSCAVGKGRYRATGAVAQGRRRRPALLHRARGIWRHGPRLPLRRRRVRGIMALRRERPGVSDSYRSRGDLSAFVRHRSTKA